MKEEKKEEAGKDNEKEAEESKQIEANRGKQLKSEKGDIQKESQKGNEQESKDSSESLTLEAQTYQQMIEMMSKSNLMKQSITLKIRDGSFNYRRIYDDCNCSSCYRGNPIRDLIEYTQLFQIESIHNKQKQKFSKMIRLLRPAVEDFIIKKLDIYVNHDIDDRIRCLENLFITWGKHQTLQVIVYTPEHNIILMHFDRLEYPNYDRDLQQFHLKHCNWTDPVQPISQQYLWLQEKLSQK